MTNPVTTTVFALPARPFMEQIAAIERGLPCSTLKKIAVRLGIPKHHIINALCLEPQAVSARERTRQHFDPMESEVLLRLLRVCHVIREVFATDAAVGAWLDTLDSRLEMKTPLEMLSTGIGASIVENLARAMVHGVPL